MCVIFSVIPLFLELPRKLAHLPYVIMSKLLNFHFQEYSIFVYRFGLKHAEPNIAKIFKIDIILITKYLNLN